MTDREKALRDALRDLIEGGNRLTAAMDKARALETQSAAESLKDSLALAEAELAREPE